jgi:predicted lysophospholipase L1 biosynthesis ABC-type transport system permease subunit
MWIVLVRAGVGARRHPRLQDAHLDPAVLGFAVVVSVLTAIVFGLVPLAQVMRVQVADRLKHGSKGVARPVRQPLRRAIVVSKSR